MTLVVDAGAVAALEVEEADGREVGAAAVNAQISVGAFAVLDTSTLTVGAGTLVRNTDSAIITGQPRTIDEAISRI
jgi:hypothetical protein